MTVDPREDAQVGHYYLKRREYAEAWRRYEQAGGADPEPEPRTAAEWLAQFASPHGLPVFQSHCLAKLGRREEARARLAEFRRTYPPRLIGESSSEGLITDNFPLDQPWLRDALEPGGLCVRLLQDLYIAEVYVSLDAAEDGRAYFRAIVDSSESEPDVARLSAAVALSQILLLERSYDEYTELATEILAPLLLKTRDSSPERPFSTALDLRRQVPDLIGGLALLPLMSKTFLANLSENRLRALVPRWNALQDQTKDDFVRLGVDLIVEALSRHLGLETEQRGAAERLRNNAAGSGAALSQGVTDRMLESVRGLVTGAAFGGETWGASRIP